ncbi:MAG: hypothetical protein AAFP28_04820 [Pseudomonadota bacterium]
MDDVARYLHLTREVMPDRAREPGINWPVSEDHCFQRIVLDHIAGGRWTDHINRPAYKNLNGAQAARAVRLCEDILAGREDLHALNQQSLSFRRKVGPRAAKPRPAPKQTSFDL